MEVWELVAREGIRDVVARYNANGDAGRSPRCSTCSSPRPPWSWSTDRNGEVQRYEGHEAISTIFTGTRDRSAATTTGPTDRPGHVRHFVATHQIDLEDRTHATGRSYFAVLMPHGLDHWGRYLDRYEERDGRWLFTQRRALADGRLEPSGG